MSEENFESSLPTIKIDLVDQRLHSLEKMFTSFMVLQAKIGIKPQWCGVCRGWIVRSQLKGAIASIVLVSYSK